MKNKPIATLQDKLLAQKHPLVADMHRRRERAEAAVCHAMQVLRAKRRRDRLVTLLATRPNDAHREAWIKAVQACNQVMKREER